MPVPRGILSWSSTVLFTPLSRLLVCKYMLWPQVSTDCKKLHRSVFTNGCSLQTGTNRFTCPLVSLQNCPMVSISIGT